jgi:glycosyltransferase involved in cell wall biosynthesis
MHTPERLHIAYVTTGYPYVSHTFIQNEVLALRRLGVAIDTFTIWRSPVGECRTAADRDARETTYAIRPPRPLHYLRAHARALATRTRAYFGTLARTVWLGRGSPRDVVRHVAYFVQGVVLWDRLTAADVRHVHAHFANVSSDVAMVASALSAGAIGWSFTMHGPTEFYDVRHHRLGEKAASARFVVCISDFARSQLMAFVRPRHWEKLHVVHCGVDVDRFAPARQQNGRPPRVTCVGRLVPEKGQGVLIDAVDALRGDGIEAELTLVGDGPERRALESLVSERRLGGQVTFTGAVAHTEVEAILAQTDVFCLPSFAEGVPIVLMEAMSMELPAVACRVMGIPELIEHGSSGWLVSPGSTEDLVEALRVLCADAERRAALGRAGRAKVAAEYELHASARAMRSVFSHYVAGC